MCPPSAGRIIALGSYSLLLRGHHRQGFIDYILLYFCKRVGKRMQGVTIRAPIQ